MRIEKLKEKMQSLNLDAFLFTNRNNIFYFSGYSGEGMLLVKESGLTIITDFRYVVQAGIEAPQCGVAEIGSQSYAKVLADLLSGVSKAGFEEDEITVAEFADIKSESKDCEFVPTKSVGINIRMIKEADEIALLQHAADATQDALFKAYETAAFGMSEEALCAELEYYLRKKYGATPSFDFIIASGENGSMPHAVTGSRKFTAGDMITLDFGAKIARYNSDMTRTFSMGKPGKKMSDIYKMVQEAQTAAQSALAPGKICRDIDKIARDIIDSYGYGQYFGHGTGHGVGLNIHEEPRLNPKSETVLCEGMVVTVEPGIYIPGLGGVRIENTCYITKDGYVPFFDASTDLNIIDGGIL
jgi:Xaa-Pro aminopeptidase